MKKILLLAVISIISFNLFAQSEYMVVTKKDGSTIKTKIADVDSVSFTMLVGEQLGAYAENGVSVDSYDMEINPVTKVPTFFIQYSGATADQASSVVEIGSNGWTKLGAKGFTNNVSSSSLSLAFDSKGVPYSFFVNTNKKAQVMKFVNGAWANVGAEFGTVNAVTGTLDGIAMHTDDNPVVGIMSNVAVGAVPKRTLLASYFDGTEWLAEQTVAGVAATDYLVNVFNAAGSLYCGFIQQGVGGSYKLYKYNGEFTWEKVCDFLPTGASQPNTLANEWAITNDGKEIYLLAGSDAITNATWFPTVFRYTVDTKTWTQVGEPLSSAGGANKQTMQTASRYDLTLDNAGNPMVFYKDYDNNYYPTIVTLNPESRQWNTPIVLENYSLGTKRIMLKSIEPGTQYAVYVKTEGTVSKVNVVKLNY